MVILSNYYRRWFRWSQRGSRGGERGVSGGVQGGGGKVRLQAELRRGWHIKCAGGSLVCYKTD